MARRASRDPRPDCRRRPGHPRRPGGRAAAVPAEGARRGIQPLSLQAHPTTGAGASRVRRARTRPAIPLDSPERNYKDPFHKPELIYALSDPFRALCGFRPVAETRALLRRAVERSAGRAAARARWSTTRRCAASFEWLITRGAGVDELSRRSSRPVAVDDDPAWDTVRLLADRNPGDPGIAISLLLHTVDAAPGRGAVPARGKHPRLSRGPGHRADVRDATTCCAAG